MLKFRSYSCLSKQNKSTSKFKINIGLGHENAWRIWSSQKWTYEMMIPYNTKSMYRIDWINGMIWLGYFMAGIMWHLNKQIYHCNKKYGKTMLMLDYHSVQCS
jgi:hypothetical protein